MSLIPKVVEKYEHTTIRDNFACSKRFVFPLLKSIVESLHFLLVILFHSTNFDNLTYKLKLFLSFAFRWK